MNATHRRVAKYRLMGLGIIILSLFFMAVGVFYIQQQQQLAVQARLVRTR